MGNIEITILWSINLHIFIFSLVVVMALMMLFFAFKTKSFNSFFDKYRFWFPQYNIMVTALAFTGVAVMGMRKFDFGWNVWFMILIWLVIVGMSIKSKIETRKITNNPKTHLAFRKFSKKKYSLDIILLMLTYLIV